MQIASFQSFIRSGIPAALPPMPTVDPSIPRAPKRPLTLTANEPALAVRNALRYFEPNLHSELAPEFAAELASHGRIYMHRFRPDFSIQSRPIGRKIRKDKGRCSLS